MFLFKKRRNYLKEIEALKKELSEERGFIGELLKTSSKAILELEENRHDMQSEIIRLNRDKRDLEIEIEELKKQLSMSRFGRVKNNINNELYNTIKRIKIRCRKNNTRDVLNNAAKIIKEEKVNK